MLSVEECRVFDIQYDLDTYAKSIEQMMDKKFSEIYSAEADPIDVYMESDYDQNNKLKKDAHPVGTMARHKSMFQRSLEFINNLFITIFSALGTLIVAILSKLHEIIQTHKFNKIANSNPTGNYGDAIKFAKQAQDSIKKMEPYVKILNKSVKEFTNRLNSFSTKDINQQRNPENPTKLTTSDITIKFITTFKLLILLEKVIQKIFKKFRNNIIEGTIGKVSNGHIDVFTTRFINICKSLENAIKDIKNGNVKNTKVLNEGAIKAFQDANELIKDTLGKHYYAPQIILIGRDLNGRDLSDAINRNIENYEYALNDDKVIRAIAKDLFGVDALSVALILK